MEKSDGRDSSVVQRPIVIMSMNDTIEAAKGLQTVAAPIVSFIDMITIGLWTTEESRPSDSYIRYMSQVITRIPQKSAEVRYGFP